MYAHCFRGIQQPPYNNNNKLTHLRSVLFIVLVSVLLTISKLIIFTIWNFREGGIRVLLSYCNGNRGSNLLNRHPAAFQTSPPDIRILALRGLGAICCVAECIRQFESVRKCT